jgi:hypothetical protein
VARDLFALFLNILQHVLIERFSCIVETLQMVPRVVLIPMSSMISSLRGLGLSGACLDMWQIPLMSYVVLMAFPDLPTKSSSPISSILALVYKCKNTLF